MPSEVRDDPLKAQQIPTKTKLVLQAIPMFYVFLIHIWNGNAGLKCTFRAPKESHQVSIKSGAVPINMDCMLGFLLSYLSFLQEMLSWMMDIFSFLEWTEFQAEALLMNLLRSAWEPGDIWEPCGHSESLHVKKRKYSECIFWAGWLDGFYWTMSQSKDFCCVYSCSNFKRKNYSSLRKCFLWWRSCCSNNMSYTKAHNPIKHPSLKLKTCYKSLHNIALFSIAFSAACSVAKQRVATLLTWHAHQQHHNRRK